MKTENPVEQKLQKLIEDYLAWKMRNNPTLSTMFGYNEYNDLLEDFSPFGIDRSLKDLKRFSGSLDELSFNFIENFDNQMDYELLRRDMKNQIREIEKFRTHLTNPSVYPDMALQSIYLLSNRTCIPLQERTELIIKRMSGIPDLLSVGMENVRSSPECFLEAANNSCYGGAMFLGELVSSLKKEMPVFSDELNSKKLKILDALEKYKKFLNEDLVNTGGDYAIGRELFDEILYDDYMLDYGSDEVLEIGRDMVAKTQKQLKEVSSLMGKDKDWKELYSEVRLNHPPADKIIETYSHYMEKARLFVIEHDLMDMPKDSSVVVKPSPEFLRMLMPTAAYNPPALLDEIKTGIFMVTPVDTSGTPERVEAHLRDHNTAEIITTTLHEAYPGHHLQMSYAANHPHLMRRHVFTPIFAEGWALYCEQLMRDCGYFEDPSVDLCWLRRVLWRSLRIIIDVSLHTRGMSVDEAVSLMVKELLFSEGSARGEVIRYTMTPAQPLSYVIGELELLKLRDEYRSAAGESYSIKKFHQDLLSCGTLPVRLLKKALLHGKR